ncbi:hypothetical protein E2562_018246, partial [Oryza meyeriana var. granulata]
SSAFGLLLAAAPGRRRGSCFLLCPLQNLAATMFDDDDDVEPQVNDVDNYYFEESEDKAVCFSVLPIKFDENKEVACSDYKEMNLHGRSDNNLHKVFKKVTAWRVELDCQQPKISVLSSEGNWIELLKPLKWYYEKYSRSILITVQTLHFIRKWPRKQERRLFDHLCEVFDKFGTRPNKDDIRKHHNLIKLFMERDPILMKSKIIRCFIEDASRTAIEDDSSDDNDDDSTDKEDTDTDTDTDGNAADDDTDMICAICDDGGKLLSCEGRCKRSFHPRVKHGRKSNCRTLRFTSAELKLKESGTFLCENCEHNEHQCFKCGELEPSYDPNAKVFQCNKESCGHFYHPKCIAVLLEPEDTDGACKLAERISDGMSFTCPVHWCFKCGKMEDRTQTELQFAVCRRCPRSYHTECLPRVTGTAEKEISAGTSQDMAMKGVLRQPSRVEIDGMSECFVQIADKLHWYVLPGDTIVDLCFNMDNFSPLMKEKLEDVGKRCNFKNYDLFHNKKDLCVEENWVTMQLEDLPHGSNLVMVLDLPLGIEAFSANKLVDKVLTFKPRVIIIVAPTDIESHCISLMMWMWMAKQRMVGM